MKKYLTHIPLFMLIAGMPAHAQIDQPTKATVLDTTQRHTRYLPEITLVGRNTRTDIHQMPEIVGSSIFAGKKNSLIVVDNLNANIVTNTMRQVIAKVPGVHTWESDGSGIQIGIAARGLSPNRSWEFNVRQNGYDISSDPFGYPEAYYTPQLQAVQRLQIIRGSGALQYGPQFGGMVNFILRDGSDIEKKFEVESQNTAGSFGLFNSYNAIGGQAGKFHYYAFYDHRQADGWRENSRYKVNTGFASAHYQLNSKLKLSLELMRWHMRSQQPGGLTDSLFTIDAKQSLRSRNWFDIVWNTATAKAIYQFNEKSRLEWNLFTLSGNRNSVGFMKAINIADTIQAGTLQYQPRQLDIDEYRNWGTEARYLTEYNLGQQKSTISAGMRYFAGATNRFRNGKGSTGTDYDMTITGEYPTDVDLNTRNLAFFAENVFRLGKKWLIVPGIRFEHLNTRASGRLSYNSNGSENRIQDETRTRNFVLLGMGTEFHVNEQSEIYANITQAYRPMLFSDLTASPTTDVIDPELKDARGYNVEIGYRGRWKQFLRFDAGLFFLQYNNRIGSITQFRPDSSSYQYRTNVANSSSKGVEALVEFDPVKAWLPAAHWGGIAVFASYAFTDARYDEFRVVRKVGNELVESNLKDNKVEQAPEHILRAGITYYFKGLSITTQYSYVSSVFSDANNTITPGANAQNGLVPAYHIWDISGTWRMNDKISFRAGMNNLANKAYFTRRAGGYPGPGILPSDGRNGYITLGIRL